MDRKTRLEAAVFNVLQNYAEERQESVGSLKYQVAFDKSQGSFFLILFGWQENEQIYHLLTHIDIIEDKIWIQEDQTEDGFADLLLEGGIEGQEIVLAYFSEFHRQFTDFAVS